MRVLATSTPGVGHLQSIVPLLAALRDRGHDVLVVTAEESCGLVDSYGFAVHPGGMAASERRAAFVHRLPDVMALPPRERRALFFTGFFADAAAPVMHADLVPVFADFAPDIVVHETGELAAAPMSVARGTPHVTVAFSGALPPAGDPMVIEHLTALWAAEGLPPPTMSDIRGDLYVHPFPPSFGQVPPGDRVRPMRPIGFDPSDAPPPAWLDDLGSERPLVYLTSGTEPAGAMAPWAAATEALGRFDVDVIATIGSHVEPSLLGVVPPNVRVERFVPQRFVLERASVAMSHGGAGSVLGAARFGVPQVLNPLGADQWENSTAATDAGVAITCELDERGTDDIAAAVDRLLHDAGFAAAATRVAEEIAAMPAPSDLVETIEALAVG